MPHTYSVRVRRTTVVVENWTVSSPDALDFEGVEDAIHGSERSEQTGVTTTLDDTEDGDDDATITEIIDDETGDEL